MVRKSRPKPPLHCSFCGRSQHQVHALVAGPKVFICDGCAATTVACLPVRGKLAALSAIVAPWAWLRGRAAA